MLPDKNLGQPAIGLQHNGPTGAEAKVSLELTPVDSVALSDRCYPGERARCRLMGTSGSPVPGEMSGAGDLSPVAAGR
jgi:hypothetical protein